jgi:hypothetical protein
MPFNFSEQQAQHIARQQNQANQRLTEKTTAALLLLLEDMAEEVSRRIELGQYPIPISGQHVWEKQLLALQLTPGRTASLLGYNFAAELMTSLQRATHSLSEDTMAAGFLYASIDEYFERASKRQANTFIRKVESTYKKSTERLDAEGTTLTAEALSKAVMLDMKKFNETYAKMVAVTGMVWASREGSVKAYLKAGVVKWKWVTRGDDKVCPFCSELEGTVVSTGAFFVQANTRFPAQKLNAAGGEVTVYLQTPEWNIQHPPLHNFCRCVILPHE